MMMVSTFRIFLFSIAVICVTSYKRHYKQLNIERKGHITNFLLKSNLLKSSIALPITRKFDNITAVILAGYAFDSYNPPRTHRSNMGGDGTAVTYLSTAYLKELFKGAFLITAEKGKLLNEGKEEKILNKLLSGENPNPFAEITIPDEENSSQRIIDVFKTAVKEKTSDPNWQETYVFYVDKKAKGTVFNISVYSKDNLLQRDDLIGTGIWKYSEGFFGTKKNHRINLSKLSKVKAGTIEISAEYVPFDNNNPIPPAVAVPEVSDSHIPRGASPALLNWQHLLSKFGDDHELGKSLRSAGLHQVSFVNNLQTETEAYLWADFSEKKVVVAFRGTEMGRLGDFITDISLFQAPFLEECSEFDGAQVHQGFLKAFRSVQDAILQQLQFIFKAGARKDDNEPNWTVFITGHSLGGALAVLLTADVSRIKAGISGPQNSSVVDAARKYILDDTFRKTLEASSISCYTYGTPRVGNSRFKEVFDSLAPDCYRVAHKLDIVARLPRSSKASIIAYEHVGKTVIIDQESENEYFSIPELNGGKCPLEDVSLFDTQDLKGKLDSILKPVSTVAVSTMFDGLKGQIVSSVREASKSVESGKPFQPQNSLSNPFPGSFSLNSLKSKVESVVEVSKSVARGESDPTQLLQSKLSNVTLSYDALKDSIAEVSKSLSNASLPFETSEYVEQELRIFNSIKDGSAIQSHLEPTYFFTLRRAINSSVNF